MPERKLRHLEMATAFPPAWCARACKNSLSDKCLEWCAVQRDGSWFDARSEVEISDLPRFPLREFVEEMGPKERTLAVGLYTALMVDRAQGREAAPVRRRNHYRSGSGHLPADTRTQTVVGVTPVAAQEDSSTDAHHRTERENST